MVAPTMTKECNGCANHHNKFRPAAPAASHTNNGSHSKHWDGRRSHQDHEVAAPGAAKRHDHGGRPRNLSSVIVGGAVRRRLARKYRLQYSDGRYITSP